MIESNAFLPAHFYFVVAGQLIGNLTNDKNLETEE
jgi:hypothetical protein